ncbi:hypothetical protein [Clostridioides sp. ES-S-0048-02]|uniref:hypothetical protein n=1 Tax=Clostridioides sp. ES-S-0048-02 TaxID=2770777 RepID=UPI001D11B919|nr:hypothetical protein [Clostridioides sp. ES-S-0048-02]
MKKITIAIMMIVIIFALTGCKNTEEMESKYTHDQQVFGYFQRAESDLQDNYGYYKKQDNQDLAIADFQKECQNLIKDMNALELQTKEGKTVRKHKVEQFTYLCNYLIENWGMIFSDAIADEGYQELVEKGYEYSNDLNKAKEEVRSKNENKSYNRESRYFIFGIIVGTVIFAMLNKMVNIRYFGCAGITFTWGTCIAVSTYVIAPIVGELLMWVIGIGSVIILYATLKNKSNNV